MKKVFAGFTQASLIILIFALSSSSSGRQQSDPGFNTSVAKPAYTQKNPQVLFDEAHSNAHTSAGTYKPFVDLITNDGYKVTANKQPFTKQSLVGNDLLVIVNAKSAGSKRESSAFTQAECDAISEWVKQGGALLLVVGHAPFGSAASELAKRFDVNISPDYTVDKVNFNVKSDDQTELIFSRANKLLLDHPITNGLNGQERVNQVITFSGTSLKGPEGSTAFLKLGDTALDIIRPDIKQILADTASPDHTTVSAAGRGQAVAFEYGKGRVIVFAEPGALTAQITPAGLHYGMSFEGMDNKQLALNMMHWLSGLLK